MTVFQFVSTVGIGVLLGAIVWLLFSIVIFLLMVFGGGWFRADPDQIGAYMKVGLVIGAIHGALVSLGILLNSNRGPLWQNILASVISSEVVLVLALIYAFYSQETGFRVTTLSDTTKASIIYFLVFSAILAIPTLLIGVCHFEHEELLSRRLVVQTRERRIARSVIRRKAANPFQLALRTSIALRVAMQTWQ